MAYVPMVTSLDSSHWVLINCYTIELVQSQPDSISFMESLVLWFECCSVNFGLPPLHGFLMRNAWVRKAWTGWLDVCCIRLLEQCKTQPGAVLLQISKGRPKVRLAFYYV